MERRRAVCESNIVPDVRFTIPGVPVGKGRPRFSTKSGRAYTPTKTANFETLVRFEYHQQTGGYRFEDDAQLGMAIAAYFEIPTSKSKKVKAAMKDGKILHTSRPDIDNIVKGVADALNHIAYKDDSAIAYVMAGKHYSTEPRTEVAIWRISSD